MIGYTVERECLTYYFDKLTEGMSDWKMSIARRCSLWTGTELYQTYCNELDGTMNALQGIRKRLLHDG